MLERYKYLSMAGNNFTCKVFTLANARFVGLRFEQNHAEARLTCIHVYTWTHGRGRETCQSSLACALTTVQSVEEGRMRLCSSV